MRFTEHELTAALTGAAKSVVAARRGNRGRDVDTVWEEMTRYERFKVLDALGNQVLPVLVALPDVEVAAGARPTYTDDQVRDTVNSLVPADLGRVRRFALVKARTALVQVALAHVPLRRDPDALTG